MSVSKFFIFFIPPLVLSVCVRTAHKYWEEISVLLIKNYREKLSNILPNVYGMLTEIRKTIILILDRLKKVEILGTE